MSDVDCFFSDPIPREQQDQIRHTILKKITSGEPQEIIRENIVIYMADDERIKGNLQLTSL